VLILTLGRVVAEGSEAQEVRLAAAPRRRVVRVPPELRVRVAELFAIGETRAELDDNRQGDVAVTMPADLTPEAASTLVLSRLLDAGVPVLGFTPEGGRLSDAFLAVTAEAVTHDE
jgi:ABC-2 type transport system ATP-binding protein